MKGGGSSRRFANSSRSRDGQKGRGRKGARANRAWSRDETALKIISNDLRTGHLFSLVSVVSLLVLSFIGYIKGSSYLEALPFDPTFAALVIVIIATLTRIPGRPYLNYRHALLLIVLILTFILGIRSPDNSYMSSKITALATIVPATLAGGVYILRGRKERFWWVWGNVIYGFLVFAVAQIDPAINATGQLGTAGGNPIGSARATGAALAVLGSYLLFGKRRYLTLAGMVLMAFATVSASERGPALAAVVAVMVTAGLAPRRGKLPRILLIGGALIALGWWLVKGGYISSKLTDTGDVSSTTRLRLWSETWHMTWHHPFGIGWGGLFDALPVNEHLSSGYVQYPHNVFCEVSSEAGLLAAVTLVAVIFLAFKLQRKESTNAVEASMLALLIFFIVNSLVSSDITGNRGLWVSLGAGLATQFLDSARNRENLVRNRAILLNIAEDKEQSSAI